MKKNATRYCAGPAYLQDVLNRRLLFSSAGSSSTRNHHHHFFVSGIGQEKTVDAAKICGGAENVVKTEAANIRKWIARFYYFRAFILRLEARVCHNNCMSCPSIWATLSLLMLLRFLPVVLRKVISLSLRVK